MHPVAAEKKASTNAYAGTYQTSEQSYMIFRHIEKWWSILAKLSVTMPIYLHTAVVDNDTVDAHNSSANIISEVAIVTSQSMPVSTSTAFTGTRLRLQ